MKRFGFLMPVLVDSAGHVIAGHGRIAAAQLLGWEKVPTVRADHLTPEAARAFQIADNRLGELATWDTRLLGLALKDLSNLNFDLADTSFETAESDLLIRNLELKPIGAADAADEVPAPPAKPISRRGDLWLGGKHSVLCGDARQEADFVRLMGKETAALVFIDPPYNVPIAGNVSGLGKTKHGEFVMASGEMSSAEFTAFLIAVFTLLARYSVRGSVHYVCMDWRHLLELITAGNATYTDMLNLCVWLKDNAGMGSFYRSQHELVAVFRNGKTSHKNNVQLGKFGRSRSNVWSYRGANTLARTSEEGNLLKLHSTPKPVALVMDAILDASVRGDIVIDSFLGSGTSLIAAERSGRVLRGMELDPRYVDVALERYQRFTGDKVRHAVTGRTYDELKSKSRPEGKRNG